jgi:alginate O-acetyltransferase complex protein AlgI
MSFLSTQFAILFGALLALLLIVRASTARKVIVLAVSAIFYAWADWRFLFLLATVTLVDYRIANALARQQRHGARRALLTLSIVVNLSFLFVFKYAHFAAATVDLLAGRPAPTWSIALPVGISFYIFETLSYVIDVYRGDAKPARSLLDYAVFVSFFPRLIAGPIMRARQFLPQLERGFHLSPSNLATGAQWFASGVFKKMVVADNLAIFVDRVYRQPVAFTPYTIWAASFSFAIQVYADFSAYTDMATGLACVLGIELPPNFRLPFTSQSTTELWQRWHISLSTWLRDYLYIPLGGNRRGEARTCLNLMITMLLGGLWHGAGWTFVIWGGLQGVLLVVERLLSGGKRIQPMPWTRPEAWLRTIACFTAFTATLSVFRSRELDTAAIVFRKLFFLDTSGIDWIHWSCLVFVPAFWIGGFILRALPSPRPLAWSNPMLPAALALVVISVMLFMPLDISPFIYFRF